jgi:hypothetical protein
MKKITAIMIALIMLAAILISCADDAADSSINNNNNNDNNNIPAADDQNGGDGENAAEARILPDLPSADFEGYMFTFLAREYESDDWVSPSPLELVAEEITGGDPINDAVFRRNTSVMERYNINIEMVAFPDEAAVLRRAVGAGDSVYDAVLMFNNHVSGIVTGGLLTNIDELPYIDLSKPWWDPAVNALSIDNKNFLMAGDLLILDNEATNAIFFNKDLMADLGLPLPYSLVDEGKWTIDALHEMARGAAADLNGDGVMTPAEDRWGFFAFDDTMHALLVGGGGALALKDEFDIPFIDFTSERNLTMIERIMDLMYNTEYTLNAQAESAGGAELYVPAFSNDRILFMWARMRVVEQLRGMERDFGILPIPKFNEAQESYHSVVNAWSGALLGVPKSADNLDRVSIVLEALAAESRYTLQPAYYDVALTRKYMRDEESEAMLDIIFSTRVYDIGSIYGFGDVWINFIGLARTYNRGVLAFHERRIGAMERGIDRVVETFRGFD